jgi:GNAT superfamily N-acetyltransferase
MGQFAALQHDGEPTEHRVLPGLGAIRIRPLSLADWPSFCAFGNRLERNDVRLRFAGPVKLDESRSRRLLDIDHIHEEAFAAFDDAGAMLGVGRLVRVAADEAEIALIVRSDLKRRGLGRVLLDRLIRYADAAGLAALRADVLYENMPMVDLAQRAGFRFVGGVGPLISLRMEFDRPAGGAGAARPAKIEADFALDRTATYDSGRNPVGGQASPRTGWA